MPEPVVLQGEWISLRKSSCSYQCVGGKYFYLTFILKSTTKTVFNNYRNLLISQSFKAEVHNHLKSVFEQ